MQDLLNKDGIGIRFNYSGGVILILVNDADDEDDEDDEDDNKIYLGKVNLEEDGSYTATPDREYKYGTVWEDECKPQEGFIHEHYAALYLTSVAATHSEYSNVTDDNVSFIRRLIKDNFK